jgi:hypothetical protein
MRDHLLALGLTLALEVPVVAIAWAGVAPMGRRVAAGLAVNLATHGLLWLVWPGLPGSYAARLVAAELGVVLLEAAAYRLALAGSLRRALAASLLANALSVGAGLLLWRLAR